MIADNALDAAYPETLSAINHPTGYALPFSPTATQSSFKHSGTGLFDLTQPIRGMMQSPVPIPQDASCESMLARFLSDDALYALPVVDKEQRPVSLIDRKEYVEHFSKMYVREIFGRRSVFSLLHHRDFEQCSPVVIDDERNIAEVAQIIIDGGLRNLTGGIIIVRHGRYAGVANGHDVLRAIMQSKLSELTKFNTELEMRVAARTVELKAANKQLESFSYTIAHDLRGPVRTINGFSEIVLKQNASTLDPKSIAHLQRVIAGSRRMGEIIDDLLNLARLSRQDMKRRLFDFSATAAGVVETLVNAHPERRVTVNVQTGLTLLGDPGLIRVLLENLIGNAWKFTAKTPDAIIDIGIRLHQEQLVYFVRDTGAGFDMQYVHKLFKPFQRLHHQDEFEGTGIGLATVKKIVQRHGGTVTIESAINAGTTVSFTIGAPA